MTTRNPIVFPNCADHGQPTWLDTGLLNTAETPWADDRIRVGISNIPVADEHGNFERVNIEELVWLCAGVVLKEATPEQLELPEVKRLLAEYGETPPVEFRSSVKLSYGAHDVIMLENLSEDLVANLGTDIVDHIKAGRMHVINISGDCLPTGSDAEALDPDGNPIVMSSASGQPTYKMTRVRRPFDYQFNAHDLWRAHFEDTSMAKPGTRVRNRNSYKRFAGQVEVKNLVGTRTANKLAIAMGIMPDDDCSEQFTSATQKQLRRSFEDKLRPGWMGMGRIFLLAPNAINLIRGTILRLQLDVLPSWLALNPSPMPRGAAAREAMSTRASETVTTTATIGEALEAKAEKPRRLSKKERNRLARAAKDAEASGAASESQA